MELEDLKNTWMMLDNRLGNKELLNDRLLKEIVQSKTNKALSFLNRYEFIGALLCFIGLPFLVFRYGRIVHTLWGDVMLYFCIGTAFLVCIMQSYKLWLLWRIDMNNSISENIKFFRKYQLFIQREKMVFYIWIPIFFVLVMLAFHTIKMEMWRWVAIISAFMFGVLFSVWQYKTIYGAKIRAIKKNLDELKELEAETEDFSCVRNRT